MATRFIRCPLCYGRLAVSDEADHEFDLHIHRLSGHCRAIEPPKRPKERKPREALQKFSDEWSDY